MQYVLDMGVQYGLTMIAALTDFYVDTPFHPQGDDGFYQQDLNGFTVLNHQWFAGGYQTNYQPFVQHLVSRFANHEGVFASISLDSAVHPLHGGSTCLTRRGYRSSFSESGRGGN